jgi:death-on-curing protein
MSEPRFLTVEQVERLHQRLIEHFGGLHGLRDPGLLEGAVIHPRNVYYYALGDLFDVAAAYAFHIAQAQAFIDGNKRTGVAAALSFLLGNRVAVPANTDQFYEAMLAVAERRTDKARLAALLRQAAASE